MKSNPFYMFLFHTISDKVLCWGALKNRILYNAAKAYSNSAHDKCEHYTQLGPVIALTIDFEMFQK
jgi:hypothetical protein